MKASVSDDYTRGQQEQIKVLAASLSQFDVMLKSTSAYEMSHLTQDVPQHRSYFDVPPQLDDEMYT